MTAPDPNELADAIEEHGVDAIRLDAIAGAIGKDALVDMIGGEDALIDALRTTGGSEIGQQPVEA